MEDSHSQQQPTQVSPMKIDGAEEDQILSNSSVLTRREVLTRRLCRVKQLSRCYRRHYWALMGEVKTKYREYCWTYGKSPFKEDEENPNGVVLGETGNATENNENFIRCAFSGCKSKAMALTRFCHTHILSDSKQKLYRGCTAVAKKLPTGPSYCNKPVLRSTVPCACPTHYQLGEKCLLRALKRAGYNVPVNSKPSPKLHELVPEFVRQIQNKRKALRKATLPKPETE
ncbi:INO80 complex subunit D-like [Trifolium pratense]|uniref:INO80 complex subunit D-like n=1 Tax=Trifolium pratense TaxID=57577 RepID=UPI001E6900C3|nr:INO80 complex subunit D-like [Trifolium pratense]